MTTEPGLDVTVAKGVAKLMIRRERRRNALDDATMEALREALARTKREGVGAIVLCGEGTKAFCAGSDLKEMASQTYEERLLHTELGQELGDLIEAHPAPVIAAIEGYCLGGGLELAAACDYRIAGRNAVLGLPEVAINALPSWGGTVRLPRIIGVGRTRELVLFGRTVKGEEAEQWGLVARAVEDGTAVAEAMRMAEEIAAGHDRRTVAIAKHLLSFGYGIPARSGRHLEYLADMNQLGSEAVERGVAKYKS
ncbi:enoyl-CoA hydratase/isomerase family protein [Rhodoligotrophos defluvii]|uniref:enoyl-CoA hydratase/isomerase family protein n=1 Tax=Rhodoligotrophos defluvii TaxID=2561934 RepID=UPI0010C95D35|nr:enoyl-CoA hydratase/isomerase family protein [Rhodoligotrophos defluvii]